jgi:hypothetical protein
MTDDSDLLEKFVPLIRALPGQAVLRKEDILIPDFRLRRRDG